MKWHQLNEDTSINDDNVVDFIQKNCQPYLNANPDWRKKPLFRGIQADGPDIEIKTIRADRQPKDVNIVYHDLFNAAFASSGFKTNRTNSLFCTGSIYTAESYGVAHAIFPIGNFDFMWSPSIPDLYQFSNRMHRKGLLKFNNPDEKVLTPDDLTPYLKNQKALNEYLQGEFSFHELIVVFDYIHYGVATWLERLSMAGADVKDLLKRLDFDVNHFNTEFAKLYETTDLSAAIRSGNEIMISGNKYIAIANDKYNQLVKELKL